MNHLKLTLVALLFAPSAFAKETSLRTYRFAEAKSVREKPGLPPNIELTVEVACNEKLVKAVREELVDESGKTTILVGAFVKEDLLSSCAGTKKDIKVMAGHSFSGRQYEISRIKTGEQ